MLALCCSEDMHGVLELYDIVRAEDVPDLIVEYEVLVLLDDQQIDFDRLLVQNVLGEILQVILPRSELYLYRSDKSWMPVVPLDDVLHASVPPQACQYLDTERSFTRINQHLK